VTLRSLVAPSAVCSTSSTMPQPTPQYEHTDLTELAGLTVGASGGTGRVRVTRVLAWNGDTTSSARSLTCLLPGPASASGRACRR
jgi:hypothetical protein